jgi:hypothetical protein
MKIRQRQLRHFRGFLGVPSMASLRLLLSFLGHRVISQAPVDVTKLPPSYTTNSLKEEHLLLVADNFSRQYSHLCPDRVPLFLHPLNECNVPVSLGLGGQGLSRSGVRVGNGVRHTQFYVVVSGSNPSCPVEVPVNQLWPVRGWRDIQTPGWVGGGGLQA